MLITTYMYIFKTLFLTKIYIDILRLPIQIMVNVYEYHVLVIKVYKCNRKTYSEYAKVLSLNICP